MYCAGPQRQWRAAGRQRWVGGGGLRWRAGHCRRALRRAQEAWKAVLGRCSMRLGKSCLLCCASAALSRPGPPAPPPRLPSPSSAFSQQVNSLPLPAPLPCARPAPALAASRCCRRDPAARVPPAGLQVRRARLQPLLHHLGPRPSRSPSLPALARSHPPRTTMHPTASPSRASQQRRAAPCAGDRGGARACPLLREPGGVFLQTATRLSAQGIPGGAAWQGRAGDAGASGPAPRSLWLLCVTRPRPCCRLTADVKTHTRPHGHPELCGLRVLPAWSMQQRRCLPLPP